MCKVVYTVQNIQRNYIHATGGVTVKNIPTREIITPVYFWTGRGPLSSQLCLMT